MDKFIFQKLNGFVGHCPAFDLLAVFCAKYLGYFLVVFLFIYFLKDRKRYQKILLRSLMAAVFSRFIITEVIRFFWERSRPFMEDSNVKLLLGHSPSASFPSGHAAFFFGFSTMVYLHDKKTGIIFLIASFLISISRVYGGIHWPSDILAGAVIGILSAYFIEKISPKIKILN